MLLTFIEKKLKILNIENVRKQLTASPNILNIWSTIGNDRIHILIFDYSYNNIPGICFPILNKTQIPYWYFYFMLCY